MEAAGRVRDNLLEHLDRKLVAIDPATEARRLIGSSSISPASSGSTPAP